MKKEVLVWGSYLGRSYLSMFSALSYALGHSVIQTLHAERVRRPFPEQKHAFSMKLIIEMKKIC